ncbi:MAG: type III secretion system chaperone, partial [Mailhella sp.]|nr:type III secretion system chaperone [Mailhella sp.]
ESFYAELLRMNSLFRGTSGATFGLEDDTVTMQAIMHMDGLTQEAFNVQAVTFLEALAAAMESFDAIAERAASAAPEASDADILAMQNMLRI